MQLDAGARAADVFDELLVTGLVQHEDHQVLHVLAQGAGHVAQVDVHRGVQIDHIAGLAGHHQLLHVIAGAGVEHAAARRHGHRGDGIGTAIGQQAGAFHRVHGHVQLRAVAHADLFTVVQHGGVVLFAFTDDHDAVHMQGGKTVAHGVHGGAVTGLLVAAAQPAGRRKRGGFRDANDVKSQVFLWCFRHGLSSRCE